jgi:hypothetical protein
MTFTFSSTLIEWRGPPPYLFAPVPANVAAMLREQAKTLSYGWGCIPASIEVGTVRTTTAVMPRHGGYLVPIKVVIQRAEGVGEGDVVAITLLLNPD